jgi:hypothetical protein
MHVLTRRAFPVAFEWRRLGQVVVVAGGLAVAGDLLLPTHGVAGLLTRLATLFAIPLILHLTRFEHPQELAQLRALFARLGRSARVGSAGAAAGLDSGGRGRDG